MIAKRGARGAFLGAIVFLGACGGPGERPPTSQVTPLESAREGAGCVLGPLRLTLGRGWCCFPATESGKLRGLGVIPLESPSPAALMISEAYRSSDGDARGVLLGRLEKERKELAPKYRSLGHPMVESHGAAVLLYVEGEPVSKRGVLRREGYVLLKDWYARVVQILPTSGPTAARDKTDLAAMLDTLTAGASSGPGRK